MEYPKLFSPIKLADGLELRNRLVMAPMATNFADESGVPTPNQHAYYKLRARKGIGMIVSETNYVREDGKNSRNRMGLHGDHVISSHIQLTQAVHEESVKICAQLHFGGYTISPKIIGRYPLSCSATPLNTKGENLVGLIPRKMNEEDIKDLITCYADAAGRAVEAGYDAIQIHCAHGYLLNSFLSGHVNKRMDAYGGSDENRMRIVLEIFEAVRERIGNTFPMSARFSGEETCDGGYGVEFIIKLIKELGKFNICEVNISGGNYEDPEAIVPPFWYKKGTYAETSGRIKRQVNVPVSTVGRITHPRIAEDILERGDADLIYLGRELVAFPEFPEAARWNRPIRECIGCNKCFHSMAAGEGLRCSVNPWIGKDAAIMEIEQKGGVEKTKSAQRIAVIGGGPAGLTAAAEAAKKGHQVTLYERETCLGGKLNLAGNIIAGKDSILRLIEYQEIEARGAGVELRLNTKITAASELNNPDLVILAVGGRNRKVDIPGLKKMWSVEQAIENMNRLGQEAVIIGGGLVGIELAEALVLTGRHVSIIEILDDILIGYELPNKRGAILKICELGVEVYIKSCVAGVENGNLKIEFDKRTFTLPYDDVVLCAGCIHNIELKEELIKAGLNVVAVGDCLSPGKIFDATQSGLAVVNNLI